MKSGQVQHACGGFNFEKGGGFVGAFNGGGVLEWGSHCVDLCQWAVGDTGAPVEYNPPENDQIICRYENGVELVIREKGWIGLGSCPVRFEGETGWIETGDDAEFGASSESLLLRRGTKIPGYCSLADVNSNNTCNKKRRDQAEQDMLPGIPF